MAKWVFGFKNLLVPQDQRICYYECSDSWVGGWVPINPNIVHIFKSVENNGRSLMLSFFPYFWCQ